MGWNVLFAIFTNAVQLHCRNDFSVGNDRVRDWIGEWRAADEDDYCQLCYFSRSTALGDYRRHFGANSQRIPTSFLKQIPQGKGNIRQPSKHGLNCRQVTLWREKSVVAQEQKSGGAVFMRLHRYYSL